jgi:transcriptional regulator with XRE-family HTH domain
VKLGEKIKEARLEKGLTQAELEKLSGVGQSTISDVEKGIGSPAFSTISRLAGALGLRLDELEG